MKKYIRFLYLLPMVLMIIVVTGWKYLKTETCVADGTQVCYDQRLGQFSLEEDARVIIEVPNAAYGDALVTLFTQKHPEATDTLSYVLSSDETTDIAYMTQNEAALNYGSLQTLDETFSDSLKENLLADKSAELNQSGLRFIPMSGSGFSFLYNATVIQRLGFDLTDSNKDGLIDSIDTLEKLKVVAQKYLEEDPSRTYTSVFPISFNEILSFYPWFTTGGWQLFASGSATIPGFETPEFLKSLELIQEMGSSDFVTNDPQDASTLVWQYDQVLTRNEFLFSMASEWMFVDAFEIRTGQDVRYSRFPSVDGVTPKSWIDVDGYVVQSMKYPSAIHEVLRIVRSLEGLSSFANLTQNTILADPSLIEAIEFDTLAQKERALAYTSFQSIPLVALKGNPAVLGFSMYRQIDILPLVKQVFLQEITPQQAQIEIIERAETWIEANHGYPYEERVKNESQ